jgi:hypothetical protein
MKTKLLVFAAGLLVSVNSLAEGQGSVVPATVIAKHIAIVGEFCNTDAETTSTSEAHDLADGSKLYIVTCMNAAYQSSYRVYLLEAGMTDLQQVMVLQYDETVGGITSTLDLMNAYYDAKTQTLGAFAKGRGLADCGQSSVSKVIKSKYGNIAVRTVEIRSKLKCDGKMTDWPVVFRQK